MKEDVLMLVCKTVGDAVLVRDLTTIGAFSH